MDRLPEIECEGGGERARERESERTIGEKRGMGNGEMASEWVTRTDRGGGAYEPEIDLPGARQPRRQRPPYTRRPTQHPCWAAHSRRDRIPRALHVSPYMVPIGTPAGTHLVP